MEDISQQLLSFLLKSVLRELLLSSDRSTIFSIKLHYNQFDDCFKTLPLGHGPVSELISTCNFKYKFSAQESLKGNNCDRSIIFSIKLQHYQ